MNTARMLQIRENRGRPQVVFNGEVILDDVSLVNTETIELLDLSELRKLEKFTFGDLNDISVELEALFQLTTLRYLTILPPLTALGEMAPKEEFTIEYYFDSELPDWKKPYSFSEYTQELLRICESRRIPNTQCQRCDSRENEFGDEDSLLIKFSISDPSVSIGDEIERTFEVVRDICSEAVSVFLIRLTTALTTVFDFPEEVETPCEQYLLYFVELLRQLGVRATSKLMHQPDQVLFTVYPSRDPEPLENGLEALKKLQTALELYVCLPSSTLEGGESAPNSVTHQLLANIHHLRTQLTLRQAFVQAEQVVTGARLLSNDVVRRSLRLSNFGPPREQEQLVGDLDCLTLDEGDGLKINLPKMYDWLKDLTPK